MAQASHEKWHRLGDGSLVGQDFEEGLGHTLPLSVLRNVLLILFLLTAITVWASRIDFGTMNIVIAIVIASIKAGIVGTYFMHLKFEGKIILIYVAYPLVVLFILVGGCVMDVVTMEGEHILPFAAVSDDHHVVIPAGHGSEDPTAAGESTSGKAGGHH